jgi:hypothetical protein
MATIKVIEKDGITNLIRFRNKRAAREAARLLNTQSNVRCAFVLEPTVNA